MDNAIFPNKFKAALAAHQVQIGCWCALANPISTEVLGLAGFDWLVLTRNTRRTTSPRLSHSLWC